MTIIASGSRALARVAGGYDGKYGRYEAGLKDADDHNEEDELEDEAAEGEGMKRLGTAEAEGTVAHVSSMLRSAFNSVKSIDTFAAVAAAFCACLAAFRKNLCSLFSWRMSADGSLNRRPQLSMLHSCSFSLRLGTSNQSQY